jgi:RNA polymerase sigma-70 factor (ECF subfamily)
MATNAAVLAPNGVDEAEVRRFVGEEYAKVVAGVALITGDRATAEDMVQDAMVKAWQRRDQIQNLAAWVTVAASNGARSTQRRRTTEKTVVRQLEARVEQARLEPVAEQITMNEAILLLPERQRQLVVLYYYLGFPVAECAETFNIHEGTVKTSLHRARAALGTLLGDPDTTDEAAEGDDNGR